MDNDTHAQVSQAGRSALALGLGSPLLLVASLVWVHHWNVPAVLLVAAWGFAMLGTPIVAVRTLRRGGDRLRAELGLAANLLCWVVLLLWGLAILALGAGPPSCGGG